MKDYIGFAEDNIWLRKRIEESRLRTMELRQQILAMEQLRKLPITLPLRLDAFHHAIDGDSALATQCGLSFTELPDSLIGCSCKHPLCQHPVTCPACLQLAKGVMQ